MHAPPPLPDDLLLFPPAVPQRRRAAGWTAEAQRAFIKAVARCGLVSAAARSVGLTARSAYQLRSRPEAAGFAAAWDAALGLGREAQLATAIGIAAVGRIEPVWYRGRIVGERVRHNDGLIIAALKAIDADAAGGLPPHHARLDDMAQRAEAEALLGPTCWGDGPDPGPPAWPASVTGATYPQAARRRRAHKAAAARAEALRRTEFEKLEAWAAVEARRPIRRGPRLRVV